MIKRLEKLLLIPLALSLTGCPEKFEFDKTGLEINRVRSIKCQITAYLFPDEGKRWDVVFQAWYDVVGSDPTEPDYQYWYSRRKSLEKASIDCDNFFKYMRFPK